MTKLSSPRSELRAHYQVVVIGSGYGGAIAASRLSRAGREVCLLERGSEIRPGDYPSTEPELLPQIQTHVMGKRVGSAAAMFSFHQDKDINVVSGCGLGGTSLINAGICIRADESTFKGDHWPEAIRNTSLEKYYQLAESMLQPSELPGHLGTLHKVAAFKQAAGSFAGQFKKVPILVNFKELPETKNHLGVEQNACVHCGDCITGCNYGAKNTVLMNYLPDARQHGAHIFTEITVESIQKESRHWRINIVDTQGEVLNLTHLTAEIVIVAAGTLGSNEILLRSRVHGLPLSDKLGSRFSGNGDMISLAYNSDHVVDGVGFGKHPATGRIPVGPTSSNVIDCRNTDSVFLIEAAIPGAFAKLLPASLAVLAKTTGQTAARGFRKRLQDYWRETTSALFGAYRGAVQNTLFVLAVAQDDSSGVIRLENDAIKIDWSGVGRQPGIQQADRAMHRVSDALGATYIPNPVWNELTQRNLLTGHPLGGCTMADSAEFGVVNHKGQVFSKTQGSEVHTGLYVMDGSIVAGALGVNPLLTISGLVERCCDHLAQDYQWTIDYRM